MAYLWESVGVLRIPRISPDPRDTSGITKIRQRNNAASLTLAPGPSIKCASLWPAWTNIPCLNNVGQRRFRTRRIIWPVNTIFLARCIHRLFVRESILSIVPFLYFSVFRSRPLGSFLRRVISISESILKASGKYLQTGHPQISSGMVT